MPAKKFRPTEILVDGASTCIPSSMPPNSRTTERNGRHVHLRTDFHALLIFPIGTSDIPWWHLYTCSRDHDSIRRALPLNMKTSRSHHATSSDPLWFEIDDEPTGPHEHHRTRCNNTSAAATDTCAPNYHLTLHEPNIHHAGLKVGVGQVHVHVILADVHALCYR